MSHLSFVCNSFLVNNKISTILSTMNRTKSLIKLTTILSKFLNETFFYVADYN